MYIYIYIYIYDIYIYIAMHLVMRVPCHVAIMAWHHLVMHYQVDALQHDMTRA